MAAEPQRRTESDTPPSPLFVEAPPSNIQRNSEDQDLKSRILHYIEGDYDPAEEKLLDSKFDSLWQPRWIGHTTKWRLASRLGVIAIAITLLWLTSLAIATAMASLYVVSPSYTTAFKSWEFTVKLTRGEAASSAECVTRELYQCHVTLNQTFDAMLIQYEQQQNANNEAVQEEELHTALCSTNWDNTILSTSIFLQKDFSAQIYNLNCTADELSQLKGLLGDVSQQKSDVYLANAAYARTSQGVVASAAQSMKNRTDYDAWYIDYKFGGLFNFSLGLNDLSLPNIGNIDAAFNLPSLNVGLGSLADCIALANTTGNCPLPNFPGGARDIYNKMKLVADTNAQSLSSYATTLRTSASVFYSNTKGYVQTMEGIQSQLNPYFSAIESSYNVDLSVWPSASWFSIQTFDVVPPIPIIPSPDVAFSPLQPAITAFQDQLTSVGSSVHQAAVGWADAIGNYSLPTLTYFDDYNPPPLTVDTAGFDQTSSQFLKSSAQALDGLETATTFNFTYNISNLPTVNLPDAFSLLSAFSLRVEAFTGHVDLFNVFSAIGSISFLLVTADVIYRVFMTWWYVRKYTRMTEVGLPQVDIRKFDAAQKGANPTLLVWQFMTHPLVLIAILACFAAIIIAALVGVYIPMYNDYVAGCRHSNNGTLLTHNAFSFAYNFAATDSNEQTAHGVAAYDKERTDYCAQYSSNSQQQQSNAQNAINSYRQTYDQKSAQLVLYQKCVTPSALPNDTVFLNVTGYHSPYINSTLETRLYCSIPNNYGSDGLGDGVFNCSNLPPCNMSCTGPDKNALIAATYDSGCMSEWMFHAGMFRFLLALLVYVCLNVSRMLIMMAVVRLCWRSLTAGGFEYIGTCTRTGKMDTQEDRLQAKLETNIKLFERGAVLWLFLAVVVHIPYIVILSLYGNLQSN